MRRATLMLAALGLVFGGVENVRAGSITVLNPGFESLVLAGPGGPGNFAFGNIPSWNVTGQTATFKPGPTEFPGGVPEGVNVAAVGNGGGISAISQTLAATLQANMTYTLTVDVGQRLDFPLNGYTIQLMAGAVTLASDSSLAPAPGTFLSDTISYNSGSSPAQLGQNLTIQLSAPASGQVDFDAVTLDASPAATPEPATITLLGIGIAGMAGYGWGRRKAFPAC
jgi:hypothetical protein